MFQPEKAAESGSFRHVVLALELRIEERGYGIFPLQLRKAAEARYVAAVSLPGGQKRPLCEAVKLKYALPWRPQDAGDARVMGYLQRKAANRE